MGSRLGGSDDEPIVDINITPFVDIVLVVLIIFMVTATYIMRQGIKVNLPNAATGETVESSSLAVTIDVAGQRFLDGEPVTESDLRTVLKQELARVERGEITDVVCLIGADLAVAHGEVVGLIDLVKQEGVTKFALQIEPEKPPVEPSP